MELNREIDDEEYFDLDKIIDFLPDIFLLVDDNGYIVRTNDVLETVLGWKSSEVIGSEIEILLSPNLRKQHVNIRNQFYKAPITRNMNDMVNLSALHKDGHLVPVDIKLSYMVINGRNYGAAIVRDATVQRKLQNSLEENNRTLKKLSTEKNNLLGIVSHDMRNPIGVIQNFSQILLTDTIGSLNEEQNDFVSRIYRSSIFMMGLLEDLLDFSTIESGEMSLVKEEFSFSELLDDVICMCRIRASDKQIGLALDVDSVSGLMICADKRKLHQVLNNLVDNAIKYSHQQSEVNIYAAKDGGELVFKAKDQGVGIPKADKIKLFNPFCKAKNKPTNGEKSTGLGLFITKRIIDAHNGNLSLESIDGQGSEFIFRIPLS